MKRTLIPHTLAKKATQPKPSQKSVSSAPGIVKLDNMKSPPKLLPGVPDDDSEDEEEAEGSNFFSLGGEHSKAKAITLTAYMPSKDSVSAQLTAGPSVEPSVSTSSPGPPAMDPSDEEEAEDAGAISPETPGLSDAPLEFKPMAGPSYPMRPKVSHGAWGGDYGTNQLYNLANYDKEEDGEEQKVNIIYSSR